MKSWLNILLVSGRTGLTGPKPLEDGLKQMGIEALYQHQVSATDAVRKGENVIVSTPTASGKSLIYNLPVFEQIMRAPDSTALYLFPLKALAQDQLRPCRNCHPCCRKS